MTKKMTAKINGGFWSNYQKIVREKMIPYQWNVLNDKMDQVEPSCVISNFEIAAGRKKGHHGGMVFQDSDLYKWIEAAAYSLKNFPDSDLEKKIDWAVDLIADAQLDDGYLHTYYQLDGRINERWTNLRDNHELYCAGHLIEAAVAYYEVTGKKKLMEVAEKFVHHIEDIFLIQKCQGYSGHEEIELALIRLYKTTNREEYLKLATEFLRRRGTTPHYFDLESQKYDRGPQSWWDGDYTYSQSHEPVTCQKEAVGHAVRAMYLYCAMADVAKLNNDEKMAEAIERLWDNVTEKKMSVNGGIGASAWGEAFSQEYDLPNDTVYNETCASVGLVFWAKRMLLLNGDAKYADIMENALYNGCLCGMDIKGERFLYVNPLEINNTSKYRKDHKHVKTERQKWFNCACCPPNLARLIESVSDYVYRTTDNTIFVDLYAQSCLEHSVNDSYVKLSQITDYPWSGSAKFKITLEHPACFTIAFRVPQWASDIEVKYNGTSCDASGLKKSKGYLILEKEWKHEDEIEICFPMDIKEIYANTKVAEDNGKIAISRGPLIYCAEEKDNGSDIAALFIKENKYCIHKNTEIVKDAVFITVEGERLVSKEKEHLYSYEKPEKIDEELVLIPYYLWGNRGYGEMSVWIKTSKN